ncbi:hypothetical protein AUO94_00470 [Planococcus kocurii]|uniref:Type I restriction modification DNA specificity domain-containing protein n=1 Tax=Planococcus kocurii TaxID=1374 RepID=A0ABM5WSM6_9BACL|nr:restriction endonuclease subunit S [Planococcus kocurii]ALS77207.1 hypothetical protein AUO94_00470 [Planococcus kocurii]
MLNKFNRKEFETTYSTETPEGWKIISMGDLFDFYGGMSFSRAALSDEGLLYLHYGDIHKKNQSEFSAEKDTDWLPRVNINPTKVKSGAFLETGDIVFADASEDYEGIGKSVVIINTQNKPFVSGLHTIVAKQRKKLLDNGFKKYFLKPNSVKRQFIKIATGSTVFGISKSNIKTIKALIPPIQEQQKIAEILTSVDEAIEKTEAIIEQTEKVKKGLMQQLLTKGIGHTEFKTTALGEVPEEWEVLKLVDIVGNQKNAIKPGPFGSSLKKEFYVERGYKVYGQEQVIPNDFSIGNYYIDEKKFEELKGFEIKPGDLLISLVGTFGKIAIVPEDYEPGIINPRLLKISFDETKAAVNFYKYYMSSSPFYNQLRGLSQGGQWG